MKNIIIGTAGHVDHGKTCLINALTGTNTDRLSEEKNRGITIELGFAELPNDLGVKIGIIDVPGHEKFIKNMLAGVGGIDFVLLIVALDEGVMPQTREHFEILKMLKIKKGIVVLTKKDMVDDPDWIEMLEEDVRDMLEGSFLEGADFIEVSSHTGENIEELRELIFKKVSEIETDRRDDSELFRLPVDRCFVMPGFGTVVTGTLIEGSCKVGDELTLYPSGKMARVRGIQNHGVKEDEAMAGQRTAINLSGLEKSDIKRGDVLAKPGMLVNTKKIDAYIKLFDDAKWKIKNNDNVHISYGSAETTARIVLLSKDYIEKGEGDFVQIHFPKEIALKRDDRFIIRFFSPTDTIGGGEVLSILPFKHKRKDERAIERLKLKKDGSLEEKILEEILELSFMLPDRDELSLRLNFSYKEMDKILKKLKGEGKVYSLDGGYISAIYWESVIKKVEDLLKDFHEKNTNLAGMEKAEFINKLCRILHCSEKTGELLGKRLIDKKKISYVGSLISLKGFSASYSKADEKIKKEIEDTFINSGIEVPSNEELNEKYKNRKLVKIILSDLASSEFLVKVDSSFYMKKESYEDAFKKLKEAIEGSGSITLPQYRDMMGTSRKYAIMLLESFDARKLTKICGDARVLR